jgi:hypothetical protein
MNNKRTNEALAARRAQGVTLGKPKGTISLFHEKNGGTSNSSACENEVDYDG